MQFRKTQNAFLLVNKPQVFLLCKTKKMNLPLVVLCFQANCFDFIKTQDTFSETTVCTLKDKQHELITCAMFS